MIWLLILVCAAALGYQLLAFTAAILHLRKREHPAGTLPPVSILKPLHGLDPNFRECLRSHAVLDYPDYEILFGVSDPSDPAIPEIERLIAEFPGKSIRLLRIGRVAPNRKAGVLAGLAAEARHGTLVINDSDILVPPDYLRRVVAPLEDPRVGLVTCLYRASAERRPARWEALGVAADFAPGVLVAPFVGVSEFALGSTMALRAADLARIGGFEALEQYLADDYQLARHITGLGYRVALAKVVVETHLAGDTWSEAWRHQVRWARTIRVSRGDGYLGMPVTHAGMWAILAALAGLWWIAVPLIAVRLLAALTTGVGILGCRIAARDAWLIPLRDVWAFGVWAAGLAGDTVEWRGARLRLTRDGRIEP